MKKLFWGLFFIVAGAFVIIDQLGGYTGIGLFSLICTIFLIPIFISSLFKLNFPGVLFSAAFLCIIYKEPLGIEKISNISILLTALLGSIGLSILFHKHHHIYTSCYIGGHNHRERVSEVVVNSPDEEEVNFNVNFGSSIKYVNSEDFKVANLRSSFGSMQVYFDNAKIKGDTATINIDASFSGVELYFPKEWKIVNKIDCTLGGVDIKNESRVETTKTVTLTGKVSLGAIEIIYI
jgi:predicted membrane protein